MARVGDAGSSATRAVTVAVSRRVRPGHEAQFAEWVDDVTAAASRFPGHLGSGYVRPAEPDGEHTVVYRFDSPEHLDAWQSSDERKALLEHSREFIVGEPRVEMVTGLESWFSSVTTPGEKPPPAWKQAALIWLGLYPTVLVLSYTVLLPLRGWPIPLRTIVSTGLSVALMTWIVMPNLTRWFGRWLSMEE